jgi:hypothetical protein
MLSPDENISPPFSYCYAPEFLSKTSNLHHFIGDGHTLHIFCIAGHIPVHPEADFIILCDKFDHAPDAVVKEDVLKEIEERCENDSIHNITTLVGEVADPLFPEGELDMVIMMRAFHDFEKPESRKGSFIFYNGEQFPAAIKPDRNRGWSHFLFG